MQKRKRIDSFSDQTSCIYPCGNMEFEITYNYVVYPVEPERWDRSTGTGSPPVPEEVEFENISLIKLGDLTFTRTMLGGFLWGGIKAFCRFDLIDKANTEQLSTEDPSYDPDLEREAYREMEREAYQTLEMKEKE